MVVSSSFPLSFSSLPPLPARAVRRRQEEEKGLKRLTPAKGIHSQRPIAPPRSPTGDAAGAHTKNSGGPTDWGRSRVRPATHAIRPQPSIVTCWAEDGIEPRFAEGAPP